MIRSAGRRAAAGIVAALLLAAGIRAEEPGAVATAAPCIEALAQEPPPEPAPPTETPAPPTLLSIALKDTVTVLTAPIHWSAKDWLIVGASTGTVVGLGVLLDSTMRREALKTHTPFLDDFTKVAEPFGAQYGYAVLGVYGAYGLVFKDEGAKEIAVDGAMSTLLAAGIITPTLKKMFGRARPRQDEGAGDFKFFGSDNSFPSGHATTAFAIASVIATHSDKTWVVVSSYTIAGLVAFCRIYHDAHWASDVTAGALIGTAVGHSIVRLNENLRHGEVHVSVSPEVGYARKALNVELTF